MQKYASKWQLALNLREGNFYLLDWGDGRTGLYIRRPWYSNSFKTNLAASGTKEEMEALVEGYVTQN